jgi:hypothetical protein
VTAAETKLTEALALLAALRDHVDFSNEERAPFNEAWKVARVRAKTAALEYLEQHDGPTLPT